MKDHGRSTVSNRYICGCEKNTCARFLRLIFCG